MTEEKPNVSCPFCGEEDFDLIGLKYHLTNYCEVYKETEVLPCLFGIAPWG